MKENNVLYDDDVQKLELFLDGVFEDGYDGLYTEYDIGGLGHYVVVKKEDKEEFLDAFAEAMRERAEKLLTEYTH